MAWLTWLRKSWALTDQTLSDATHVRSRRLHWAMARPKRPLGGCATWYTRSPSRQGERCARSTPSLGVALSRPDSGRPPGSCPTHHQDRCIGVHQDVARDAAQRPALQAVQAAGSGDDEVHL